MTSEWSNCPNLPPPAAAEFLRRRFGIIITVKTLAKKRCGETGPPFLATAGRRVIYPVTELENWARSYVSGLRRSTADAGAAPEVLRAAP